MRIENFPKLKRCDHSPKRYEFIDVSLDPPYFSLDSPFKPTYVVYRYPLGTGCKELVAESQFLLETASVIGSSNRLPAID
jgi:hypothetical protein